MRGEISSCDLRARIVDNRDVGEKPVAAAGDGLDEPRILGRVALAHLESC